MAEDDAVKKFIKLDKSNYFSWSLTLAALMRQRDCWDAIEPGFLVPDGQGRIADSIDGFTPGEVKKNDRALGLIFMTIPSKRINYLGECRSAQFVWRKLEKLYSKAGPINQTLIFRELVTLQKTEDIDMEEYFSMFFSLNRRLKTTGFEFSDQVIARFIISGLPLDKYEILINTLDQGADIDLEEVMARLIADENRRESYAALKKKEEKDKEEKELATALVSKFENMNVRRTFHSKNTGRNDRERRVVCFACKEPGHISRECPYFEKEDKKKEAEGKSKHSKFHPKGRFKKKTARSAELNDEESSSEDESSSSEEEETKSVKGGARKAKYLRAKAFMAGKKLKGLESCVNISYIDGGASDYMTPYEELIQDLDRSYGGKVKIANGVYLKVTGRGSMTCKLTEECGSTLITLKKVYLVPELDCTLISERRLEEKGFKLVTENGEKKIFDEDEMFMKGLWDPSAKMYKLESEYFIVNDKEVYQQDTKKRKGKTLTANLCTTTELWHSRFGHLQDLPEVCGDIKKIEKCDVCLASKSKKKSFTNSVSHAEEVLELVHSDVMGPMPVDSIGGSKYAVTFMDDYSRFAEVKPIRKKSETMEAFVTFKNKNERKHDKKLKALMSDKGGEYSSRDFENYLREEGIAKRTSIPGTPEQNGRAERLNLTLMNMVRAMLISSGLPSRFWAEAIVYAAHIRNRAKTKVLEGRAPLEIWEGRSLEERDVEDLRVFGCEAWSTVQNDKLGPRGTKCVFVGFQPGVKGFKLLEIQSGKMFVSRNVTFFEQSFPYGSPQQKTHPEDDNTPVKPILKGCEIIQYEKLGEAIYAADNNHNNSESTDEEISNRGSAEEEDSTTEEENHEDEQTIQTLRRSSRARKPNKKYCDGTCCSVTHNPNNDKPKCDPPQNPSNVSEALKCEDSEKWQEAMDAELQKFHDIDAWEIIKRPAGKNVISCKWIFRTKTNGDGEISTYKARLVARGFSQIQGEDFSNTYSPVVRKPTLRCMLAIAAEKNWEVHHVDVDAAYLNSKLKEEVYMEQPPGYEINNPHKYVCKLKRSIYGLHQSGKNWNEDLNNTLMRLELRRSDYDPCLYLSEDKDLIVCVYVDDFFVTGTNKAIKNFKRNLGKIYSIKDLGQATNILSMRITRDRSGAVYLDQTKYIEDTLSMYLNEKAPAVTVQSQPLRRGQETQDQDPFDATLYRSAMGSLLHLANSARPDIAFMVNRLCQRNQNPQRKDWNEVKYLFRYLKGTKDLKLMYNNTKEQLEVFVDADWANDRDDRKSITGFCLSLAGAAISWRSKKQTTVSLSTVEAEYIALSDVCREVTWICGLIKDTGIENYAIKPITIKVDNKGAISLAENQMCSERSKHIDVKHHYIRHLIQEGDIKIQYVASRSNKADIFTKVLNAKSNLYWCTQIGLK